MALIDVKLGANELVVSAPADMASKPLTVPFDLPADAPVVSVTVWDDTFVARAVGAEADAWFTEALGIPCRFVHGQPLEQHKRGLEAKYNVSPAKDKQDVIFADGFPYLLISEGSLVELVSCLE